MNHESERPRRSAAQDWNYRLTILVSLIFVASGLVTWRLFVKSVIEHPLYAAKAEDQYEVAKDLPSRRGTIYAQDFELGKTVPIAATEEKFDISVVPRNVKNPDEAVQALVEVFGLSADEVRAVVTNGKLYAPPLVRGASKEQRDAILERGFAGLQVEPKRQRSYPENQTAAHVLGFVNREGKGNYGIEGYYDSELRGESGSVIGQQDTLGRLIGTVAKVNPKNGVDVELSLDHNVQFAVEERLYKAVESTKAQSGQVLLMDPNSGEIIAMAGTPSYDPNRYNEIKPEEQQRFINPTIAAAYEPGSIMKPIVMAAAIDAGKVEPDTKETFGKSVTVQGYEINTALDKAYGEETMTQVLEHSDNVGMVWVAGHMSYEELRSAFTRFGFGEPTGVDLPGEEKGRVLPLKDWRDISRATMAFGQGISVTPLQILRAWAVLINGGKLVTPHVVRRLRGEDGVVVEAKAPTVDGVIKAETSQKLRGMLQSVIDNGSYGRTRVAGYTIGGKTGTAQIAAPGGGYLEKTYTHSLIGFFPVDDPKYLLMVKIDRPEAEYAESTAGPLFHDLAQYLFSYYKLPPDKPTP